MCGIKKLRYRELTNYTLRDITNENQHLKRKCELSKIKIDKLKDKNERLECAMLEIENLDLQSEEESFDSDTSFQTTDAESTFQNIIGHHKYTPEIRKLYYSLLADQVPVSKITDIILTVLKCFNPTMNVELRLPQKTLPDGKAISTIEDISREFES